MSSLYMPARVVALTICLSLPAVSAARADIKGEYVEARSASVFAGACHYNGELVTAGREAIAAWNVTSGQFGGVNLAGVRAVAVISSDENLSQPQAERQAEIVIDRAATDQQAEAFVEALKESAAGVLGRIVAVRRDEVRFDHTANAYNVAAGKGVALKVSAMPNDACCKQPNLVWYLPLVSLEGRKVGYTTQARYDGGPAGDKWERGDENSAFYGTFHF